MSLKRGLWRSRFAARSWARLRPPRLAARARPRTPQLPTTTSCASTRARATPTRRARASLSCSCAIARRSTASTLRRASSPRAGSSTSSARTSSRLLRAGARLGTAAGLSRASSTISGAEPSPRARAATRSTCASAASTAIPRSSPPSPRATRRATSLPRPNAAWRHCDRAESTGFLRVGLVVEVDSGDARSRSAAPRLSASARWSAYRAVRPPAASRSPAARTRTFGPSAPCSASRTASEPRAPSCSATP